MNNNYASKKRKRFNSIGAIREELGIGEASGSKKSKKKKTPSRKEVQYAYFINVHCSIVCYFTP
jgi:hypothetical protein